MENSRSCDARAKYESSRYARLIVKFSRNMSTYLGS